jgi:hypothetical protein
MSTSDFDLVLAAEWSLADDAAVEEPVGLRERGGI